jgi:hypothetical protein
MKKRELVKYWYGAYKDDPRDIKIAQLCQSGDCLRCEILAEPGCVVFSTSKRSEAIGYAKSNAIPDGYIILELNFDKYRIIKIKPWK